MTIQCPIPRVPYDRPTQLSDPFCDFEGYDLGSILARPDPEMGWHELSRLFQGALPAGTYEECAYFIPVALQYMANPDSEPTHIDNFLLWTSQNILRLEEDGLYEGVMQYVRAALLDALSGHDLMTTSDGMHYPKRGDHVTSIVEGLVEREEFGATVESWLQDWFGERVGTYERAAWILYLAEQQLWSFVGGSKRPQVVRAWSQDGTLIQSCCDIVSDHALTSEDPVLLDYWDGLLRRVGWIGTM